MATAHTYRIDSGWTHTATNVPMYCDRKHARPIRDSHGWPNTTDAPADFEPSPQWLNLAWHPSSLVDWWPDLVADRWHSRHRCTVAFGIVRFAIGPIGWRTWWPSLVAVVVVDVASLVAWLRAVERMHVAAERLLVAMVCLRNSYERCRCCTAQLGCLFRSTEMTNVVKSVFWFDCAKFHKICLDSRLTDCARE